MCLYHIIQLHLLLYKPLNKIHMKKIYFPICLLIALCNLNVKAVNIPVSITSNAFTPASFSANVGDVVVWTLNSGTHTVESVSVPNGAATFNSGTITSTYSYTITVAGNYAYHCGLHPTMGGSFGASGSVGVQEPVTNLLTSAYPNPFVDKITVNYKGITSIEVYNMLGAKVKSLELTATENKIEIDFSNLPSGVYFLCTFNEGTIVETKRINKSF